ncbi:hypothetical protein SAMN05421766_102195 [Zobellia uliginosa]|uniref:Uncharacterized protein n=1 Tax=Zobellia uliginosa TaxID=143224 RepID=A0ABY1KLS0_9FLAO|nr:hypothetical protein SAMN05421766_102195 [Zobellia uliginosa]
MNCIELYETYRIKKKKDYKYVFQTNEGVIYEFSFNRSGIHYNSCSTNKNILELTLKCSSVCPKKDYRTLTTIVHFVKEFLIEYDAFYLQTHNQIEHKNTRTKKRRGFSRLKLWTRISNRYFEQCDFLMSPNLNDSYTQDIPCLLIKKEAKHYRQIVSNFHKYCNTEF